MTLGAYPKRSQFHAEPFGGQRVGLSGDNQLLLGRVGLNDLDPLAATERAAKKLTYIKVTGDPAVF